MNTIKVSPMRVGYLDYDRHLVPVMALNSIIESGAIRKYISINENGNISVVDLLNLCNTEQEIGVRFVDHWADSTKGVLCFDYTNHEVEKFCIGRFEFFEIYNKITLKNLENCSYEQTLKFISVAIKEDLDTYYEVSDAYKLDIADVIILELTLYSWFKNNFKPSGLETPDSDGVTPVSENENVDTMNVEEASMINNNWTMNTDDYKIIPGTKNLEYIGTDTKQPKTISMADFTLNIMLNKKINGHIKETSDAFYYFAEATSDRKNGQSKIFKFMKSGDEISVIDPVIHKEKEISLSAAGGRDGIASRAYLYFNFPVLNKHLSYPVHKAYATLYFSDELINVRNKIKMPIVGLVPNHKSNNGIDNTKTNLEWVSPAENSLHSSIVEAITREDAGRFIYVLDKSKHTETWVSAKTEWVVPNKNILSFKLSIKDIYEYIDTHNIKIDGHSIRTIINIKDFINFLETKGVIKEA